jgi:predicted nucleotide-binding protein
VRNTARVFISYSHRGNGPEWKAALLRELQVFDKYHLLDIWQDGKIRISSFWDDDIKQAIKNAQLAVVLLIKECLESEYILNTEFPLLCERQQKEK